MTLLNIIGGREGEREEMDGNTGNDEEMNEIIQTGERARRHASGISVPGRHLVAVKGHVHVVRSLFYRSW